MLPVADPQAASFGTDFWFGNGGIALLGLHYLLVPASRAQTLAFDTVEGQP